MNIDYLKTPIGTDEFVILWMGRKLKELQQTVQSMSAMEWKHKAMTLLKHCGTFCRIVNLMRSIPPHQAKPFVREFDARVRSAYKDLVGSSMADNTWIIAKLRPKYGGMGWRTGLQTYGSQYIGSVAKTADDVGRIVPAWNPTEHVMRNANEWLVDHAGPAHDSASALEKICATAAGR